MKKTSTTRRKFISGMGAAVGATVLTSAMKPMGKSSANRFTLLNAWAQPKRPSGSHIHPVQILNRTPGSCLLPLARRPF